MPSAQVENLELLVMRAPVRCSEEHENGCVLESRGAPSSVRSNHMQHPEKTHYGAALQRGLLIILVAVNIRRYGHARYLSGFWLLPEGARSALREGKVVRSRLSGVDIFAVQGFGRRLYIVRNTPKI